MTNQDHVFSQKSDLDPGKIQSDPQPCAQQCLCGLEKEFARKLLLQLFTSNTTCHMNNNDLRFAFKNKGNKNVRLGVSY